ncbi:MAG TPA: DinB family protein [Blastocatellia bacterium]|nr:DinB family protein [Blastocatellia bacterium]
MDQREKERLLWNLKSLPNEVADLLGGLDDETLRWRPVPNKWSIKEVLCHLRDAEREANFVRVARMLSENEPYLPQVDQEQLAAAGDYLNQDAAAALADFRKHRGDTVQLLEQAPVEAWGRTGTHWNLGRISVEQEVSRQTSHDLKHLIQMKDIARLKMPW